MTEYKWCAKQRCHCAYAADDGECEFKACMYLIPIKLERRDELVRVVRCKDCKHRILNTHYGKKGYLPIKAMCELDTGDPYSYGRLAERDDWFCAWGERREDANSN